MTTATATRTNTFLVALVGLLTGAGYTVSERVEARYNRRLVEVEGVDGNAGVVLNIRVGGVTGKVLSAHYVRTYSEADVFASELANAVDVAEVVGTLAASSLPKHEQDQPAPSAGDLVIYHGRIGGAHGVYRAMGWNDRSARPVLRPLWAESNSFGHDDIRVSVGCRSITPLPAQTG